MGMESRSNGDAVARAQEVIARQEKEIEQLRGRLANERFAADLRDTLTLAASVSTIAAPVTHSRLLEMIVQTAAHVISAKAASLFLVDEEARELVFEITLGQKAEEVKKFRVPLGHGIAGLVAVSGQPMAISNAQQDPRHASDIAQAVGYTPENMLTMPLFYGDQIIGVLQLLDKIDAPSFTPADMELLGLFANQAAVAIELSRTYQNLSSLINQVLAYTGGVTDQQKESLQQGARLFAEHIQQEAGYRQALDLAGLVHEIVSQGDDEVALCRTVLQGFSDYLRARTASGSSLGDELGVLR